jgi:hypothetical protein
MMTDPIKAGQPRLVPHFISASTSLRNACRAGSRE